MIREKLFPKEILTLPVIVAALGYFVDVYDLWIFGANRVNSLRDIGVPEDQIFDTGVMLLNLQMLGMLIGGVTFGILGDKFGRTKMMFLSIITYSMATILNALVHDVTAYAVFRFIAGFGMAGELGLAITLISEVMPKAKRGYGTGIICGFGIFGAVAAALSGMFIPWRIGFIIGGVAGLLLLFFRIKVHESTMFDDMKDYGEKGKLLMIFTSPSRLFRFACCVFMLLPVWYCAAVLVTFSPELIKSEYGHIVTAAGLMLWFNTALALSDFGSAWISQWFQSRQKVLLAFIFTGFLACMALLLSPVPLSMPVIIFLYVVISCGCGCWVLGVTSAAESFGTNLRATITTTVPNFSRGSTIPITLAVAALHKHMALGDAAVIVGIGVYALALFGALYIRETFAAELDFLEK